MLITLTLSGCKQVKYIDRVETIYKTDTLIKVDSVDRYVSHYEYVYGDTVKLVDSIQVCKYLYQYIAVHDTISDTVNVNSVSTNIVYKNKPQWWPVWLTGIVAVFIWKRKYIVNFIKYFINLFKK